MASATLPRITASQRNALQRILRVTRRLWALQQDVPHAQGSDRPQPQRRAELAQRLAARAFEAQVIAIRCRKAFVA